MVFCLFIKGGVVIWYILEFMVFVRCGVVDVVVLVFGNVGILLCVGCVFVMSYLIWCVLV